MYILFTLCITDLLNEIMPIYTIKNPLFINLLTTFGCTSTQYLFACSSKTTHPMAFKLESESNYNTYIKYNEAFIAQVKT